MDAVCVLLNQKMTSIMSLLNDTQQYFGVRFVCVYILYNSAGLKCARWMFFVEDVINIFIVNVSVHLWSRYVLSLWLLHSYFTAVYISEGDLNVQMKPNTE